MSKRSLKKGYEQFFKDEGMTTEEFQDLKDFVDDQYDDKETFKMGAFYSGYRAEKAEQLARSIGKTVNRNADVSNYNDKILFDKIKDLEDTQKGIIFILATLTIGITVLGITVEDKRRKAKEKKQAIKETPATENVEA